MTMAMRSPGHAPDGYRWFIPATRPLLLHLSRDGVSTLCDKRVGPDWYEPPYTQRTKCRPCWMARASA